jgi:hypothetical protein
LNRFYVGGMKKIKHRKTPNFKPMTYNKIRSFFKLRTLRFAFDIGEVLYEGSGWSTIWIDTRTREHNRLFVVQPFAFSRGNVYIVCPYCQKIHVHDVRRDGDYEGYYASECLDEVRRKNYYVTTVSDKVTSRA